MAWVTPNTWAVNDIVTAALLNETRGNLTFVHETHGPIWIPTQNMSTGTAFGPTNTIGSDPDSLDIVAMAGTSSYYHFQLLVPDDWISGGITWKLHYRKGGASGGTFIFNFQYGHISTGGDMLAVGGSLDKTFTPTDDTNYQIENLGTTSAPTAGELLRQVVRRNGGTSGDALHMIGMEGEYT